MMKIIVFLLVFSIPAWADERTEDCDVNELYKSVKGMASSSMEMLLSSDIATYSRFEDVDIQKYGSACDFTFIFEMKTTTPGGGSLVQTKRYAVTKRYDRLANRLGPAYIFDMDR